MNRDEALELTRGQRRVRPPPDARPCERAPVDRHRQARLPQRHGPRRALRVEVSGADPRAPSPDRQQRRIKAVRQVAHAVEEIGVAGEEDARAALDEVTDRAMPASERGAPAVVQRFGRDDVHVLPTRTRRPGAISVTSRRVRPRTSPATPRGAITGTPAATARSEGMSR